MNGDGSPFKKVFERSFDIINVVIIPSRIMDVKNSELINGFALLKIKNMVIMDINIGNLPLQGIKLLVKIAISLSLLESIILAPITPTALQPKFIIMVRACLPQEAHFLNILSRLKATLGKYPKSSKSVNSGKNIAIGGSITETTHESTL